MPDPCAPVAFRALLGALATDPDAAAAVSEAYASLDAAGRDAWLDALAEDLRHVEVAPVAAYAPLASVERDEARRARILQALGASGDALPSREITSALAGGVDGDRVMALTVPLYGAFVEQVSCRFHARDGVRWARHAPLCRAADAPRPGARLDGATLERLPPAVALDELAHAVLATRRSGAPLPDALGALSDLWLR
ncbi:MAG: hypothetical protein IT374_13295 [Polyangiaceae bacterium]|nr:hypothetical protein [Polyangiaceae bacterium]